VYFCTFNDFVITHKYNIISMALFVFIVGHLQIRLFIQKVGMPALPLAGVKGIKVGLAFVF